MPMLYGSAMTGATRARSSVVERPTHNRVVTGSNPVGPTTVRRAAPLLVRRTGFTFQAANFQAANLGGGGGVISSGRYLAGAVEQRMGRSES